jgi:ribonuclease HI
MSTQQRITIYTDGACSGNPGPGGYAAILVARDSRGNVIKERQIVGGAKDTTNNRMEITAVIEGLKALTRPTEVTVVTDSKYVMNTVTEGWKRKKNNDLWQQLDDLTAKHQASWEYVKGHAGHEYNERCDRLAVAQIESYR